VSVQKQEQPLTSTEEPTIRFGLERNVDVVAIESLWRQLDAIGGHSFFCSWSWIGTWLDRLPAHLTPHLLTASRGKEIIGASILVSRPKIRWLRPVCQYHLNSTGDPDLDSITIEHNGFAVTSDSDTILWPALEDWLMRAGVDELIMPGIAENRILWRGRALNTTRNIGFVVTELQPPRGTGIESRLSRNSRQQLRRSIRRYSTDGPLRIDEATTVETAQRYFSELKDFHVRSWTRRGKPHAFRHSFFETFHRSLIAYGVPRGSVQLLRVTAGERPIGLLYNFLHRSRVYAYQSGFADSDSDARPGYVCHALAIQHNAEKKAVAYDFLAGSNQLKRTFADCSYVMSWSTLGGNKFRFRPGMAVRSLARRMATVTRCGLR
jgi:CelD/BcsL family acetyltransferase involved in cellulose biosynthesis